MEGVSHARYLVSLEELVTGSVIIGMCVVLIFPV